MRPEQAQFATSRRKRKVPTSRFITCLSLQSKRGAIEKTIASSGMKRCAVIFAGKSSAWCNPRIRVGGRVLVDPTADREKANTASFFTRGGSREPTEGATCALTGLTTPDLYRWLRPPSPARNGGYSTLTRLPIDALTGSQASGYGGKGPVPIAHGSALRSRALHAFKAPFQLSVLLITRILPPEVRSSERWFFAFAAHFGFDFSEHAGKRRPLKSGYV